MTWARRPKKILGVIVFILVTAFYVAGAGWLMYDIVMNEPVYPVRSD